MNGIDPQGFPTSKDGEHQLDAMGFRRTAKDGMDECHYSPGLMCNQKENLCSQGKFETGCVMAILRNLHGKINTHQAILKREGMEIAVGWLFDKEWILRKYFHLSISQVVDKILASEKTNRKVIQWSKRKL